MLLLGLVGQRHQKIYHQHRVVRLNKLDLCKLSGTDFVVKLQNAGPYLRIHHWGGGGGGRASTERDHTIVSVER
jgi:hypothetical protein